MRKIYSLVLFVAMSLMVHFSNAQTGSTCALAHLVPAVPFTATGLSTTADNYDAGPCTASATHMAGNDYVFVYTPASTEVVSITLTNVSAILGTGIFVTDACPDAATINCVGSITSQTGASALANLTLTGGITYYILVSTRAMFGQGQSTTFDINIQSCTGAPTALFTYAQDSLNVTFTNTSTGGATYKWLFGDELFANWALATNDTNPVHTYTGYGTFTVSMVATNGCGVTDTVTMIITLACPGNLPNSSFTYTNTGLDVSFTSTATDATSYGWFFGDEAFPFQPTSTLQNPTHTYTQYGTFDVTYIATNDCGSDTTIVSITLVCPGVNPVASFTYTQGGATFNFTNTTVGGTTYQWLFGDELINNWLLADTNKNPVHVYATDSTYTVSMVATNECGTDTVTIQLVVIGTGVASFGNTVQFACFPNPVKENLYVNYENSSLKLVEFKIFNTLGCEVFTQTQTASEIKMIVPLSNLSKGIYYLKASSDQGTLVRRIVLE